MYPLGNYTNRDRNNLYQLHFRSHPEDQFLMGTPAYRKLGHGIRHHRNNQHVSWHPMVQYKCGQLWQQDASQANMFH
eukprot:gene26371-32945_t